MKQKSMTVTDSTASDLKEGSSKIQREIQASSRKGFISQASHEIQGDFFGVSSICAMLKLAVENREETLTLLEHLMDACQLYKYKLSNFIEYTRYDAGLRCAMFEPVDIRTLLIKTIRENKNGAFERNAKIDLHVSDDMPEYIFSDEIRITQICTNLLSNAVNYSTAGTPVLIRVEKESDNTWSIIVEDRGEGMTPELLNNVFSLSASARSGFKNAGGMGLLIARYLAEDILKGKITLSSQPRVGTICKVILPLNDY
jgi:signal transduction histidine kinase